MDSSWIPWIADNVWKAAIAVIVFAVRSHYKRMQKIEHDAAELDKRMAVIDAVLPLITRREEYKAMRRNDDR